MNRTEPLPLFVSLFFAIGLMGWISWSQRSVEVPESTQVQPPVEVPGEPIGPEVDEARVLELRALADQAPRDSQVRMELGYIYLEAQRFDQAIPWFEAALDLDPSDVSVSTDLGVAYFYTDQIDRALEQFAHSLAIDPTHVKTLLDLGIVRALGKQDLEGAIEAWEQVQQLAPDSAEALAAADAIERIRSAHP